MSKLTAYVVDGHKLRIRPAPVERQWMDDSNQRFAYRCLPLNIANAHGWEILCPAPFSAVWNGGQQKEAIHIQATPGQFPPAITHFGGGVLTFHVPCIFQTEPNVDLYVTGPINRPKDGIAALTGIVETDWSPYSFTMNWLFTRSHHKIQFEEGEPFCHVFPVGRGQLENVVPQMRRLSENPELEAEHKLWSQSRQSFIVDLKQPGSQATQDRWQKTYFKGNNPSGKAGPEDHRSRLRLREFDSDDK